MTIDLRYYVAVLIRRAHYVVLIFAAVTVAAVTLAIKLPPSYESSATLLLEAPQIPTSLAPATTVNTADLEQLQVLQQRLMTRPNLLDVARKLHVYAKMKQMTPDDIVTAMTKATTINISTGKDQAALMTITFDASNAQTAANVVNEFVTRILSDNLAMRTSQAQDTLRFFKQQVDRLQGDLSAQSAKIVAFQNSNTDALPSTLDTRLQQQTSLQERLNLIDQQAASLQDQKQRLIETLDASGQVAGSAANTPQAKLLDQARSELASAMAVYAPTSPKVKMLKARVAELEASMKGQSSGSGGATGAQPQNSPLAVQTADIDSRIKRLRGQRKDAEKALAALKASIDRTPQVSSELDALNRDYANIQSQYNAASDRLAQASTGEQIQALSKGKKIGILDAATVPDAPTKPNRLKIAALGAAAGLMLGFGFVVLLELLNTSVQRPVEIARSLDIVPIGAIPYMRTPSERLRLRLGVSGLFVALVLGLPTALYAIDTYYEPLNIIMAKIDTRIGL